MHMAHGSHLIEILFFAKERRNSCFSQQTYKAPEFLVKPSNRTVHEEEQFQIFAKVIGKFVEDLSWVSKD